MFTGLITDVGEIRSIEPQGSGRQLIVACSYEADSISIGASIAHAGACLTVVAIGTGDDGRTTYAIDASIETVERTTMSEWQAGTKVNLERSLCLGDEMGGHLVTGHVDGVATIVERTDGDNPPCAALTNDGKIILTPDNGTLTVWIHRYGLKALRRLNAEICPKGLNPYAYFAALLAGGNVDYESLGEVYPVSEANTFAMYPPEVASGTVKCGIFSVLENFGNLNLTVSFEEFEQSGIRAGERVHVTIERNGTYLFEDTIPYDRSFGFAELGAPILFNGSTGYLGLGMNQASFANAYLKDRFDSPGAIAEYRVTICAQVQPS